jgi:hypothetical protein
MAKLSAHGVEIGTVSYLTKSNRYMSDGHVLQNAGFGWKLHKKLKPGVDPVTAYQNAQNRLYGRLMEHPAAAAYRAALHDVAGLNKRWRLNQTISMMPDDPDGVWSTACDGWDGVSASLEDIVELCRLYRAALGAASRAAINIATE